MKRNSSKPKRRYGDAGFTLVELVVVIAVLAILAGVGAVAYNGYIEYTKKGVDRNTVGEIMHALELANYDDPTLFDGTETPCVYFTEDGLKAYCGDKTNQLTEALKAAFGDDLNAIKLSSKDWDGTSPISVKELLGKLSELDNTAAYKQYLALDSDKKASFAGDIPDYWNDVQSLLTAYAEANGKDDYLARVVKYFNSDKKEQMSNALKGSGSFPEDPEDQAYLGGIVAGNYAFASWVKRNHADIYNSDEAVKAAIDGFKAANGSINPISYQAMANNNSVNEVFTKLATEYKSAQAEVDALAIVGMMEAASTYMDAEGNLPKDEDFVPTVQEVITSASSLLDRSLTAEQLSDLVGTLNEGSTMITISASKQGGELIFLVDPPEANPRDQSNSTNTDSDPADSEVCDKETHDASLKITIMNDIFTLNAMRNGNNTNITNGGTLELCHINSDSCPITVTKLFGDKNVTDVSVSVSGDGSVTINGDSSSGYTLNLVKTGTSTLTVSMGNISYNFTINVH